MTLRSLNNKSKMRQFLLVSAYTFFLLILQSLWISQMSYPAMRADLFLPLMLGIATIWPPLASLAWAFLWGFVADNLAGKFWGFHVGSYVVTVCLVYAASEKFELQNPLYQMLLVGICATGQSLVLGLFLWMEPHSLIEISAIWQDLVVRSLFIMLLSPFVIYPVSDGRRTVV